MNGKTKRFCFHRRQASGVLFVTAVLLSVLCFELAGLGEFAFAQQVKRPDPSTLPPQQAVSTQDNSYPPSYGDANGSSQFFEYINVFTTNVDEERRTVTITVKVVITTGEEVDYGSGEFVNVWIDFDGSGTFDANEQVMDQLQFARAVGFRGILTYTQVVSIPEDAVVHTWTRACLGFGFDPGPTGFWTWGNSITKPITLGGEFEVIRHEPESNATNVDYEDLLIEVQFGKPYEPSTLNENTFLLEYRNAGGSYQKHNGTLFHATNTIARFRPSGPLKDGVFYRLTIKGGPDGVTDKGDPPAELKRDFQWRFGTLVDLTGKVNVHTFQVSRNERLVPDKPALVRVYAEWEEKPEVHDDSEVKEFRAKVSLENGSGGALLPPKDNALIKRPDQFSAADKKNARNSVNFFNWRPTSAHGSPVKAIIEPKDQNTSPPKKFEDTRAVSYWDKSPNLEFDYYFLKAGDWAGDVPAAARTSSTQLANAGGLFTTQNFPALSTTGSGSGEFSTALPGTVIELTRRGKTRRYYVTNTDTVRVDGYVARKLYDSAIASGSTADMIVGFIPQDFQLGITGVAFNFGAGKRTVLIVQGSANASTVAHEFAHFFRQGHDSSNDIEGFRIATNGLTGWNKSKTEGNQQAAALKSLMTPAIQPVNERFILNGQYRNLFSHITTSSPQPIMIAGLSRPGEQGWLVQQTEPFLVVSGTIDQQGTAVHFDPVKVVNLENPAIPEAGPFTLELQDADANVLNSIPFDTLHTDPYHGEASESRAFHLVVPYESDLAKLVIKNGTTVIGEFLRTANAPSVQLLAPSSGANWSGTQTAQWSGSDADADQLHYTLAYSPNGEAPWIPLLNDYLDTSYELDTNTLQVGPQPTFRVIASDGLNTSEDSVSFNLANELAILATNPASGDTVSVAPSITVFFNTDLGAGTITTETFTLQDASSQQVAASVHYDDATRTASLTPTTSLQYDSEYTATLHAGLSDLYGNALSSDFSWTFYTEIDREPPQIQNLFPAPGAINVNPASWVRIQFGEALDAGTVNSSNVGLTDAQGNTINGTVEYESETNTIVFKPGSQLSLNTEYEVTVTTGIADAAGNALEAPTSWSFTTSATPPAKGGLNQFFDDFGLDADEDGIFEALQVEVGVTLLEPMDVVLIASLTDSTGNAFVQSDASGSFAAGDHQLLLSFPAEDISFNGVDGTFTLGPVYLYDSSSDNWSVLEYQPSAYQTGPYRLEQFKKAAATLLGSYSDEGIDDDGNGLFDRLRIKVGLSINEAGTYRVRGQLYDSNGFFIQLAEDTEGFNTTGDAEIALKFDGGRIRGHGDASPYELRFVDVFDNSNQLTDSKTIAYTTGVYSGSDFETSLPDLQVFADQMVLVEGDSSDDVIALRSRVFNFGGTTVDTAFVRVEVDNNPLADDLLVVDLTGIPQEFSLPWDVSQQSGSVNVSLTVDPDFMVEEIDEFNNEVTVAVSLPVTTFPAPPTDVQGIYEPGAVSLSWQPPPGGWTGFYVYRSLANDAHGYSRVTFDPVSTPGFVDTTAAMDTTYSYAITTFISGQPSLEGTGSDTLTIDTVTDIRSESVAENTPKKFFLYPAYPNPFNPATTIRYDVRNTSEVRIEIFNVLGQKVRTLVDEQKLAGTYTAVWDGQNDSGEAVASGVYLYRMVAKQFVTSRKLLLLR